MGPWALLVLLTSILFALLLNPLQSQRTFSNPNSLEDTQPARILLLTAHPDDEALFFAPTIISLLAHKSTLDDESAPAKASQAPGTHSKIPPEVYSLCLSTGDADSLGAVRVEELKKSLDILGIDEGKRWIIDNPKLQDNITLFWDPETIADVVKPYVVEHRITTILTFDSSGISSHPNHAALPAGIKRLLSSPFTQLPKPTLYTLITVLVPQKYTAVFAPLLAKLDLGVIRLLPLFGVNELQIEKSSKILVFVSGAQEYLHAIRAMTAHSSQMVWFRWLWVLFSRYMWVNEWREVMP